MHRTTSPASLARLLLSAVVAAAGLTVAACGPSGPPATATTPHNQPGGAAAPAATVHSIDWMNRTYEGEMGGYAVVDGEYNYAFDENGNQVSADYEPSDPDAFVEQGYFSVSPPTFGDLTGDGADEAVIVSYENTGGTGRFSVVTIFAMRDGKPVQLGTVPGGDRGDGGISGVHVEGNTLVVERYRSEDGDGACCPSRLEIERWNWNGSEMVEDTAAHQVVPNPDAV